MATLWSKGAEAAAAVENFTVGDDRVLDLRLAKYDVQGSKAHIRMLESIGLLTAGELTALTSGLDEIEKDIDAGRFTLEDDVEDIHSQIELLLTRRIGDIGKKIHSGRSRNDQVLVDIKLFLKDEILRFRQQVLDLFSTLQKLSEKHKDVLLPGYTHGQTAMPSSFGLWFGAYAEALSEDMYMLHGAYRVADQNPLGSAAGYGSSFPLDREMTTRLLGFGSMNYNSVAAQMSRGRTELAVAAAMGSIALTLNKFASDCCLYMCPNFGFISFPAELTTGSSIMPHGYHRDFQLLKDILFPALSLLHSCLDMTIYMLGHITVNTHIMDTPLYDCLFTVEEVNRRVLSGTPFRDAYKAVGQEVSSGTFKADRTLRHTHTGSIGNLATDRIAAKMAAAADFTR